MTNNTKSNPYRPGTKLWTLFDAMTDGDGDGDGDGKRFSWQSLGLLVLGHSHTEAGGKARKRVTALVRAMRRVPGLWVDYDKYQKTYRLVDCREQVRTVVAAGLPPEYARSLRG